MASEAPRAEIHVEKSTTLDAHCQLGLPKVPEPTVVTGGRSGQQTMAMTLTTIQLRSITGMPNIWSVTALTNPEATTTR